MVNMFGKKKLRISDANNTKLDSAIITNDVDAAKVIARWKKKGLL